MARAPAENPGKIPNDKKQQFHQFLAVHVLLEEQKAQINARIAANKKRAGEHGFTPKKIKVTHDLSKLAPSDVAKHYAEEFEMLDFQGINLSQQFNIFGGVDVTTPKKGPDFYGPGLMAAINGKDGNPPQNLKGPDQQRWLEGWNDGVAARVYGNDYLANLQANFDAAQNDGRPTEPESDEDQVDLEDTIIRIPLADFGPDAVLEDIEFGDCGLTGEQEENAQVIEVFDEAGRRNVLKSRVGETGIFEAGEGDDFEASAAELAKQTARPSTQEATDPAAAEDTKH